MIILNSGVGNYVWSNGRKYSYFGGNNYLGLASNPAVKEAAFKAIRKYGVNFSASRRTTGTADLHLELEKNLSLFKGKEDAVVFASGYQGNSILLEILKGRYDTVFMDQFSHASIVSGIPHDISDIRYFNHCDAGHLEQLLKLNTGSRPLVITDGIFALTGEIAPLDRYFPVLQKNNALLIVDDAHATGILGESGRGTPEHFRLPESQNIFQTETMSKAIGSYGGFITGKRMLTEHIRSGSATYQASTALPPPVVAAGTESLKIIRENPGLRIRLLEKSGELRKNIATLGFETTKDSTPIIPILLPAKAEAESLSKYLEQNGILVPFIQYPSSQKLQIVRITVSVLQTKEQTDRLFRLLKKWKTR
jgi:7-keto-8-aminopelargonate synthetase-like enzyme